ncbi:MAG: MATE family efflux transporter [Clostridia bacterium]|nr:MATE family efflux transporter [Clostridia bacterium]
MRHVRLQASDPKEMFSREDLKRLLIPLILETALAVTVGMADTVMVSNGGEASVSGVSLVDSINVLLIQILSALATGGAVVTSQYLGHQDTLQARQASKQLMYVVLASSLCFTTVCLVFRMQLLRLLFGSIEPDVMDAAAIYFLLTALSFPFLGLYNAGAALLRSMGNAKATLHTSILMNLINIVGNAVTIYGFRMGAAGAGLATLLSRMAASVYIARFFDPSSVIPYPDFWHIEHHGVLTKKILSVGLPGGLENGLFQFGKLLLVRMIATFGTVSIAANAVGNTMGTIQCLIGNAVSLGMITVVGQCVGAHEFGQARKYTWRLIGIAYMCMDVLNLILLLMLPVICKPFHLSPETEALAQKIILIHGVGAMTIWPLSFVLPNSLRAAGDARFTMIVSTISMAVFRIIFGYLFGLTFHMGVIGVWVAMQIDWVCRIICFLIRLHGNKWQTKVLV